jgi:hypothetical protein
MVKANVRLCDNLNGTVRSFECPQDSSSTAFRSEPVEEQGER